MVSKLKAGWMLDKRINLSNIFTALMVATSIIWWAAQIEKRIAILEVEQNAFNEFLDSNYLHAKLDKLK